MKLVEHYLGLIDFPSKEIYVTDPCYDPSDKNKLKLDYDHGWYAYAYVTRLGNCDQVAELFLTTTKDVMRVPETVVPILVDVDSGQAGFFDVSHYRKDEDIPSVMDGPQYGPGEPGDRWYSICCNITCNPNNPFAGRVHPYHGVVASSGYGDGSYPLYKGYSNGIHTLRLVFIGDEDGEEEEDWS